MTGKLLKNIRSRNGRLGAAFTAILTLLLLLILHDRKVTKEHTAQEWKAGCCIHCHLNSVTVTDTS